MTYKNPIADSPSKVDLATSRVLGRDFVFQLHEQTPLNSTMHTSIQYIYTHIHVQLYNHIHIHIQLHNHIYIYNAYRIMYIYIITYIYIYTHKGRLVPKFSRVV